MNSHELVSVGSRLVDSSFPVTRRVEQLWGRAEVTAYTRYYAYMDRVRSGETQFRPIDLLVYPTGSAVGGIFEIAGGVAFTTEILTVVSPAVWGIGKALQKIGKSS